MSSPLRNFLVSINKMSITKKTTLLFFIMVIGMFFIGGFSHLSINRIKNNFDILYTKRMLPIIRLENLKDIYTVNILDTIHDIEKGVIDSSRGKVVIALAQELIAIELAEYKYSLSIDESDWLIKFARSWGFLDDGKREAKRFQEEEDALIAKIETKRQSIDSILEKMFHFFEMSQRDRAIEILQKELYPSVSSINIDITGLFNLNLEGAKQGFSNTEVVYDKTFEWIVVSSISIISFAAFIAFIILQNIRLLHVKLSHMVDIKTKELQQLNYDLEQKVLYEVEQSRQKDQIMFRQSRLAAMGEMIGNIAHQWRQPLNALVLILQSFQMKKMAGLELTDEFIDKQVQEGNALALMMSRTIDDFRNFFKPNKVKENFSAKNTVLQSIKLIQEYYEKVGIEIFLNCPKDVNISGYPNEFLQVMMNLFSNAKDALEERNIEKKYIEVRVTKERENVSICVIDNGGGISEEVQERMFEPYFTTKHKSAGTGIGLYMSKQIIEKQMDGTISSATIVYTFQNERVYEKCAMIAILVPFVMS